MKNVICSLLGFVMLHASGLGQQVQGGNDIDYMSAEDKKKYVIPSQSGGYIFPAEQQLKRHKQELAFLDDVFKQSFDSGVIRHVMWQADHEVAITWYEPIGPNYHYYIFQVYKRDSDGSFQKIGDYEVRSSYGQWDKKNVVFGNEGFSITLEDPNDHSSITHQFSYKRPNVVFYYRFGSANDEDSMGEKPLAK